MTSPFGKPKSADGAIVVPVAQSLTRNELVKQQHDLVSSLRTVEMCIEAIKEGYRFDDTAAASKIAALEKALNIIQRDTIIVSHLYDVLKEQS